MWVEVKEYEGIYEVNDLGEVKGVNRVVKLANGGTRFIKEHTLSPKQNADGYFFVSLSKDGVTKTKYIHRLVAVAFIPNPENKPQVNHLGLKSQNTPDLLEWTDASGNTLHAYRNNLNKQQGANHTFAVGIIDNTIGEEFATIKEWCAARGINYSTGRNILSGSNKSKVIDLAEIVIVKTKKENTNG